MEHKEYIERCLEIATDSKCKKKRVGSIIVKDDKEIATGYNRPRYFDECEKCLRYDVKGGTQIELCNATHAEKVAIMSALTEGLDLSGAKLYVAALKEKDDKWVEHLSGEKFSCVDCIKTISETNLTSVITLTKDGPRERSVREAYFEAFEHMKKIK